MKFHLFVAWNIRTVVFLIICVLLMFVLFVLFQVALIRLSLRFFCSLLVVSMHRSYLECWRVLFHLLYFLRVSYTSEWSGDFCWNLSERKSPQFSRSLISIPSDLIHALVRTVLIFSLIFGWSSLLLKVGCFVLRHINHLALFNIEWICFDKMSNNSV